MTQQSTPSDADETGLAIAHSARPLASAMTRCARHVAEHLVPRIAWIGAPAETTPESRSAQSVLKTVEQTLEASFSWASRHDRASDAPADAALYLCTGDFRQLAKAAKGHRADAVYLIVCNDTAPELGQAFLRDRLVMVLRKPSSAYVSLMIQAAMVVRSAYFQFGSRTLYTVDSQFKAAISNIIRRAIEQQPVGVLAPSNSVANEVIDLLTARMPDAILPTLVSRGENRAPENHQQAYLYRDPEQWQIPMIAESTPTGSPQATLWLTTSDDRIAQDAYKLLAMPIERLTSIAERSDDIVLANLLALFHASADLTRFKDGYPLLASTAVAQKTANTQGNDHQRFQSTMQANIRFSVQRSKAERHNLEALTPFVATYGHWDLGAITDEIERQVMAYVYEKTQSADAAAQATGLARSTYQRRKASLRTSASAVRDDRIAV